MAIRWYSSTFPSLIQNSRMFAAILTGKLSVRAVYLTSPGESFHVHLGSYLLPPSGHLSSMIHLLSVASTFSEPFKHKTNHPTNKTPTLISLIALEPPCYFAPSCNSPSLLCLLQVFPLPMHLLRFYFPAFWVFRNLTCRSLLFSPYSETQ